MWLCVRCTVLLLITTIACVARTEALETLEGFVEIPTNPADIQSAGLEQKVKNSLGVQDKQNFGRLDQRGGNDDGDIRNGEYEKLSGPSQWSKTNEKNVYEKKQEIKSEYGAQLKLSGHAEALARNQNGALTLDQLYHVQRKSHGDGVSSPYDMSYGQTSYNNPELLLLIKFGRDFAAWDPRNNNSQFKWVGTEVGVPGDNAAIVVHSESKENWRKDRSEYAAPRDTNDEPKEEQGYAVQYSLPFKRYFNSTDPRSAYSYYEGSYESKSNFIVGPTQKLLFRLKFACKVINAERNPFPPSLVSNPWDDPRFVKCGFRMYDNDNGVAFYFTVTNTGVWANYVRDSGENSTYMAFSARRRVGRRARYDTLVDAALEYDRRQGVANYYLNGQRVWTICAIGVPPPEDGFTSINRGQGIPLTVQPSSFKVDIGTAKCLDEADPNNLNSRTRLVRVRGDSKFYGANDTFYDDNNLKSNILWGQGAILTTLKLLILRAESVIYPQQVVSGNYGAEQGVC